MAKAEKQANKGATRKRRTRTVNRTTAASAAPSNSNWQQVQWLIAQGNNFYQQAERLMTSLIGSLGNIGGNQRRGTTGKRRARRGPQAVGQQTAAKAA